MFVLLSYLSFVKEKTPCRRQLIRIESMVSIEGRLIIVGLLMYQDTLSHTNSLHHTLTVTT